MERLGKRNWKAEQVIGASSLSCTVFIGWLKDLSWFVLRKIIFHFWRGWWCFSHEERLNNFGVSMSKTKAHTLHSWHRKCNYQEPCFIQLKCPFPDFVVSEGHSQVKSTFGHIRRSDLDEPRICIPHASPIGAKIWKMYFIGSSIASVSPYLSGSQSCDAIGGQ